MSLSQVAGAVDTLITLYTSRTMFGVKVVVVVVVVDFSWI